MRFKFYLRFTGISAAGYKTSEGQPLGDRGLHNLSLKLHLKLPLNFAGLLPNVLWAVVRNVPLCM
jgi:hypothetical protein